MADQVQICNVNTPPLENAFSAIGLKKEESQEDDFVDDKVQISETVIITNKPEFQDHLLPIKVKQCDVSADLVDIKAEFSTSEVKYDKTHDNLKIEEGVSAEDIKIEFNTGLLYCEDCHVYCEDYCAKCGMLVHILNRGVPVTVDNVSHQELPNDILEIQDDFGDFHVLALKSIPVGVRFGPFTGIDRTELSWKMKGGKFAVNSEKSTYLNWMQCINQAKNISEQNLQVFQYEHNLYYESTRPIEQGDELLVHFGEEYEDSLNRDDEMDFIPTRKHILKDAFACTFCCLGFSSKSYLAKHKTICRRTSAAGFSIEEIMQCASCKIYLDRQEYVMHHMANCDRNDMKYNQTTVANGRATRSRVFYKCQQCEYSTKYKGDLKNHTNQHYEVKTYKCEICSRRFKTKEVLRLHVENTHTYVGGKDERTVHSTGDYTKAHFKIEHSHSQVEMKQFKCSLCEFRTKYKLKLKTHVKTKHSREFNYKCDMCDYKTKQEFYLKTHIKTKHLKEFKYRCDTCEYKTNRKASLKMHIETKHLKEFRYKCDSCHYKTSLKGNLEKHIEANHLKQFRHKCDTCDYRTNHKYYLKTHMATKHLREFRHKCDTCDYKTNQKFNLMTHLDTKHLKDFKYECNTCGYKTKWKCTLGRHIKTIHLKTFKYKCDACDYKTSRKFNLKAHVETKHLQEFNYKCTTCDYKTSLKSSLERHIDTRHVKEFKYECDVCEYKTTLKSYLQNHIESKHLKHFRYKCDNCDYKTNRKFDLKIHIEAKHLKEFKYKCGTCDYKTNRKDSLKAHIETKHLNEFRYKCDTCDYKASRKFYLRTHIETKHLIEFKYKCDTCDYKTNRKDCLKAHVETKHLNEFRYKCDTCDYKTNRKDDLKRHVKAKH